MGMVAEVANVMMTSMVGSVDGSKVVRSSCATSAYESKKLICSCAIVEKRSSM